jgi:hypothetical protein
LLSFTVKAVPFLRDRRDLEGGPEGFGLVVGLLDVDRADKQVFVTCSAGSIFSPRASWSGPGAQPRRDLFLVGPFGFVHTRLRRQHQQQRSAFMGRC